MRGGDKVRVAPDYDKLTTKAGYVITAVVILLMILVNQFRNDGAGWVFTVVAVSVLIVIVVYWHLRRLLWFWIVIATLTAIQAAIVLLVSWPKQHYLGLQLLPVALLDIWLMSEGVKLSARAFGGGEDRA
jgi:uncharacterized membrane protein